MKKIDKLDSFKRRLDQFIALKLLGFKKNGNHYEVLAGRLNAKSPICYVGILKTKQDQKRVMSLATRTDLKIRKFKDIPSFSSDPRWSNFLHALIRNSHRFCCVKIDSDYDYCHDIWLTPASWRPADEDIHAPLLHISSSEGLELAIAVAALAAFGGVPLKMLCGYGVRATRLDDEERLAYQLANERKNEVLRKFYKKKKLASVSKNIAK